MALPFLVAMLIGVAPNVAAFAWIEWRAPKGRGVIVETPWKTTLMLLGGWVASFALTILAIVLLGNALGFEDPMTPEQEALFEDILGIGLGFAMTLPFPVYHAYIQRAGFRPFKLRRKRGAMRVKRASSRRRSRP